METKDIIKGLRKKHGYTVEQVSSGAGIPKSVYPKYESGILNAGVPVLCKLADFYGVTVDYLLGREETKKPDMLTLLAQEFNLTEIEKVLVQAYIAISPKEREKFIKTIEEVVNQKETNPQVVLQPKKKYVERLGDIEDARKQEEEAKRKDVI